MVMTTCKQCDIEVLDTASECHVCGIPAPGLPDTEAVRRPPTKLDRDGQPPASFNYQRNLTKCMQALLGICQGLIADNQLNEQEVYFLSGWLAENDIVTREWPGSVIAKRVKDILADGTVTLEEAEDLKDSLSKITGGFLEHGAPSGTSTSIQEVNTPSDEIVFEGKVFCLTGKFLYGQRTVCQSATVALGAQCSKDVTLSVDYLVIGALASRDWANTSYGRKIEKAMKQRNSGHHICVVEEEAWSNRLG